MADPQFAEIRNDCRSVAKSEMRIELQAVGGRRNLIMPLQSVGISFAGTPGNNNPASHYRRQGGSSIQDSVEVFDEKT